MNIQTLTVKQSQEIERLTAFDVPPQLKGCSFAMKDNAFEMRTMGMSGPFFVYTISQTNSFNENYMQIMVITNVLGVRFVTKGSVA